MWTLEDDVLLEAVTYYKENKINNENIASPKAKCFIDPPEFTLPEEDSYYEKYGKIVATRNRLLVFHCTFCKKKYGTLFNFLQHLSAIHLNGRKEAATEKPTDQDRACDAKEISHSADFWPQHESVFVELEGENDDNDEIIPESSVKKKPTAEETSKHLTRMRAISKVIPVSISKSMPKPLSKRNAPEPLDRVDELLFTLKKKIGRRVESSQTESGEKNISDDEKSKEKEKSEPTKKGLKSRKVRKKPRKQFKCDKCDKVFFQKVSYKFHLMSHSDLKAYKCEICGNKIKYKNNISKHMLRHTNEKNFQCDLCQKSFFTRTEVKVHRRIHTGERPYVCSICGDTFKTTGSLSGHTRRHKNLYNRKCEICGKGFIGRCELKEHMIRHTGERPYSCSYCPTKFGCKKTLLQHTKLHINAKEYECMYCDKAFNQKSALIAHTKNNHRKYEI